MEAINDFFRPELINRIDKIISFKSFVFEDILIISKLMADKETKLLNKVGLDIHFTDQAIKLIAEKYYSAKFGARPIKRGISEMIKGPLAEKITNEEITKAKPITIDVEDGEMVFVQQNINRIVQRENQPLKLRVINFKVGFFVLDINQNLFK